MAFNGQPSDQSLNPVVTSSLASSEVIYRFVNINKSQPVNFSSVSSIQITSNVLTVQSVNTFTAGTQVQFFAMTAPNDFLNGAMVLITSASGTQFTCNYVHANFGPSAEANGFVLNQTNFVTLGVISQEDPSLLGVTAVEAFDAAMIIDTAADYIIPVGNAPVMWPSAGVQGISTAANHQGAGRIYGATAVQSIQVASNVLTVTPQSGNRFAPWILGTSFTFEGFTTATYLNKTSITQIAITTNVVTVTCANAFVTGQTIRMFGLTGATFLNWITLTVITANGTQFTATFANANYGPTADVGTAAPIVTSSAVGGYSGGGAATFSAPFTLADTGVVTDTTGVIIGGTFHAVEGVIATSAINQNSGGTDMICGLVIDTGNQGHTNNVTGLFLTQQGDQAGYADNSYAIYMQDQLQTARSRVTNTWAIYEAGATNRNALGTLNLGGSAGPLFASGTGSPESSVTSVIGGVYSRTDGANTTALYIKESGTSNTGWLPVLNATQNTQSGTSYAIVDGDRAKNVTFNNTAATAVSIAQAGAGGNFLSGWYTYVTNLGTGWVTITPTTSTINTFATIVLAQFQTAMISSDGTNYNAPFTKISSTDDASSLSSYLTSDAGIAASSNQVVMRDVLATSVTTKRKALNIYLEHDGSGGNINYDALQVNTGFTADANTTTTQGQTDGAEIVAYGSSATTSNFALSSVANHSGSTTVYTGTGFNATANFYAGWQFQILGFTNAANNGLFSCSASSSTTITLSNAAGIAETTAAKAYWFQINEINVLKLRWGTPTANGANILNCMGILQSVPSIQTNTCIENFTGYVINAPTGGGTIVNYLGVSGGQNFNSITVSNATAVSGFFIDSTVTNAYGGVFGAKTGSVLADDGLGVARSFIGHANIQTGPPYTLHDGWYGSTGTPEGVVTAAVGSMFSRQDSSIGDAQYLKASGSGNTGWAPSSTVGPIKTVTTTYSATNSDGTINGNGTFTITLASTGVPTGKEFKIKNIGTGTITLSSAVNIDGALTLALTTQYQSVTVQWDGTQWWIY